MTLLFLEDLVVGQRFVSNIHHVDREQVLSFAREFDPQPFHLDETAAKDSLFGGLAASGYYTAAVTMRLLVGALPFAGGLIGAGGEISWPRPVRPGDTLRVESEIMAITPSRSKPDRGMASVRSETRNQHGETVQILLSKVVVHRRPSHLPASAEP